VFAIHQEQIAEHGGAEGVRDINGLLAALAAPRQIADYNTPSLAVLEAVYLHNIITSHPFIDGNKRTAWVVCRLFIQLNGGVMIAERGKAVQFVEEIGIGQLTREQVTDWIEQHFRLGAGQ